MKLCQNILNLTGDGVAMFMMIMMIESSRGIALRSLPIPRGVEYPSVNDLLHLIGYFIV